MGLLARLLGWVGDTSESSPSELASDLGSSRIVVGNWVGSRFKLDNNATSWVIPVGSGIFLFVGSFGLEISFVSEF